MMKRKQPPLSIKKEEPAVKKIKIESSHCSKCKSKIYDNMNEVLENSGSYRYACEFDGCEIHYCEGCENKLFTCCGCSKSFCRKIHGDFQYNCEWGYSSCGNCAVDDWFYSNNHNTTIISNIKALKILYEETDLTEERLKNIFTKHWKKTSMTKEDKKKDIIK